MTSKDSTVPDVAFDVPMIASMAKISPAKVWAEIAANELETILIGDRRLATPAQIERWLERKAARAREKRAERDARSAV
jgi:hypothetical protein